MRIISLKELPASDAKWRQAVQAALETPNDEEGNPPVVVEDLDEDEDMSNVRQLIYRLGRDELNNQRLSTRVEGRTVYIFRKISSR